MDRLKSYPLLVVLILVAGCNFYDTVEGFHEVAGCYRNDRGDAAMRIDATGVVTDNQGRRVGFASLDTRPNSSLLAFTPGVRMSADQRRLEVTDAETSSFLIGKPGGQIALTVHDDASDEPGVMLVREGECGSS